MSRENREQYQVVIQAKDMGGQMGGLSGTTTVNITLTDVNNNPPRFPQSKEDFIYLMSKASSNTQQTEANICTNIFTISLWIKANPQPVAPTNITISTNWFPNICYDHLTLFLLSFMVHGVDSQFWLPGFKSMSVTCLTLVIWSVSKNKTLLFNWF